MEQSFGNTLSDLRRGQDLSQRTLAADLRISQALLSHYENGTREPGLPFVCRACDYFGVSADFLLGRTNGLTAVGSDTAAISEFRLALHGGKSKALRENASRFMDAAARIITQHLKGQTDERFIGEQRLSMAELELSIIKENLGLDEG